MIAHHTCHGGYNKQDDGTGRWTSGGFALGSLRKRVVDWFDWMLPEVRPRGRARARGAAHARSKDSRAMKGHNVLGKEPCVLGGRSRTASDTSARR
eukprot:2342560-Pleurochrysis_carterae.AAC.1